MSARFGPPLLVDRASLIAATLALGAGAFEAPDLRAAAEATWTRLCADRNLAVEAAHEIEGEDLEDALHALGPWAPDWPEIRCNCGWRAGEVWHRLSAIARGESPESMAVEMDRWLARPGWTPDDEAEAELWASAATDAAFLAEAETLEAEFADGDPEGWPEA